MTEHLPVAVARHRLNLIQPLVRSFQMRDQPAYLFFYGGCALNFSSSVIERQIQSRHERFAYQQTLTRLHGTSPARIYEA